MMGKWILIYNLIFTISLTFAIFLTVVPAYAAIEELKFDQSEIPEGHSDVITIIDSSAPSMSVISSENFEVGFNTWTNTAGDTNDCWWRDSSGTGTGNTGPSSGAPPGAETYQYVYYESSEGCSPGAQHAFLLGPIVDFTSYNGVEIKFWRHMLGNQMGKLALELENSPGSGVFTEVWSQQGNQGNQWNEITVDLSSENNTGPRQLRFVATEFTTGIRSDMAVDEITIKGLAVGPPPSIRISFEDFEAGFNTWTNTAGDTNDCWWRDSSGTGTGNTGPSSGAPPGAETYQYVYYESSDGCSPGSGQQAFLLYQDTIDFNSFTGVELKFWRHMFGNTMGKLALELEDSPGSRTFTEVWSQQGNQGNQWNEITIDLSSEDNTGPRQIRFAATEEVAGIRSDMAVDEIEIRGGPIVHEVTLQALDDQLNEIRPPMDVSLPKQGPNIYWQVVEFGPGASSETNRHFEAYRDETVRITDAEGNTNTTKIIDPTDVTPNFIEEILDFTIPADCNDGLGGDVDGDGVCDNWEIDPATGPMIIRYPPGNEYIMDETVCNSFLQADPPVPCYGTDRRDIYVEIDYMVGHRPNVEALKQVIEAFENAPSSTDPNVVDPIRLHIQLDSNDAIGPIKHTGCIKFPGNDDGFDSLRELYYGTDYEHTRSVPNPAPPYDWGFLQKKQIFHYALFVHSQCTVTTTGISEQPGNDIMITLGITTGGIGNPDEQAGTFMHELGHNLNLGEGGVDGTKCKPNHLSVMSYTRQFPDLVPNRSLDYSRQVLGTPASPDSLMEDALIEEDGIDTYTFNPNEGLTFGPIPPLFPPPTHGNINWNQEGDDDETVINPINLNGVDKVEGCDSTVDTDNLKGSNDWEEMKLNPRQHTAKWADGRSFGAGFQTAVWEDGATHYPLVKSQTCPSVQQVLEKVPPKVLADSKDPTKRNHEAAKAKIEAHLGNYRTCAGGAGESNPDVLENIYMDALIASVDSILSQIDKTDIKNDNVKYNRIKDALKALKTYERTGDADAALAKLKAGFADFKSSKFSDNRVRILPEDQPESGFESPLTHSIVDIPFEFSIGSTIMMSEDKSEFSIDSPKMNLEDNSEFSIESPEVPLEKKPIVIGSAQERLVFIETSQRAYETGERIVVSGYVTSINEKTPILLEIFYEGSLVDIDQLTLNSDGTFETSFIADGPRWQKDGKYLLKAFYGTLTTETNFDFSKTLETTDIFKVEPILTDEELSYESIKSMRSSRVDSMLEYLKNLEPSEFKNENKNSIIKEYYEPILLNVTNLIKADKFGEAAMEMSSINHSKNIQNPATVQKLQFATDTIVDQYTRAIPEFGTIATLILVSAITCIIIITTKSRSSLMLKYFN